ncbi:MAG: ECF transporter S component [Chloroflexales bacterium]|nr:ECF transporter S component [Chloroflexales bacterium]
MARATSGFWRNKHIIAMLAGILLYGGSSWMTSFATTSSGSTFWNLRPGIAVPIFVGFAFGPLVGFVVGFFGNLLGDFLSMWASLPPANSSLREIADSLQLHWQLGNGLMGLLPGLFALWRHRYFTLAEQLRALAITLLAIVIGMGIAASLDPLIKPEDYTHTADVWALAFRQNFAPIVLSNGINAAVVVPILLFNYERLELSRQGFLSSGLVRRLLLTIVISAAVPIILLSMFLLQAHAEAAGDWGAAFSLVVFVQLAITIVLTSAFMITNAALMAQSMIRPLMNLIHSAQAMERDTLSVEQAVELKEIKGKDEIAHLSRIFGTMAQEVIQREQDLRRHVQELQIIIDERKRSDQVKEIVETDFFRDLQQKARAMRDRGKEPQEPLNGLPEHANELQA